MNRRIQTCMRAAMFVAGFGALAGCETIAEGDPCGQSELNRYECTSSDKVFRCVYDGADRAWTEVDECPSSEECQLSNGGRSYSCEPKQTKSAAPAAPASQEER